jgi:predicted deacetylase
VNGAASLRATYLLRFDDLCPTMNWDAWARVERILIEKGIRPILAVIPDNQDESLKIGRPVERFWDRVRAWQARGWTIGIHGYQHRFVTKRRGLFGWNDRSEFAGLPIAEQEKKIERAIEIFRREDVRPEVWIAPNHSFDVTTVAVLRDNGVQVISDGLSLFPYDEGGMTWLPLQLWRFRPRPFGVWTVCCHHNHWKDEEISAFSLELSLYGDQIADVPTVVERYRNRKRSHLDRLFFTQRRTKRRVKQYLLSRRR